MTDPIAFTIHDGCGLPSDQQRTRINRWLTANGIAPDRVASNAPVLILTVPTRPPETGDGWLQQVIVITEYNVNAEGYREQNLISREPVTFQRTVPLRVPFPTDSTTDGEGHGEADSRPPQETPEDRFRDAREAGVSDRLEGEGEERVGARGTARHEGAAEAGEGRGVEAVPEPEEDHPTQGGQAPHEVSRP